MISYSLKENGIFWVVLEGSVGKDEIKDYLKEFKAIDFLPQEILLLYDLKKAKLNLTSDDITHISLLAGESTSNYAKIRTAFVVDDAHEPAYSYLFAEQPGNPRGVRRVFSSFEGALAWLNSEIE